MPEWEALFHEGKLAEAFRVVEQRPKSSLNDEEVVMRGELLYLLGFHQEARQVAEKLVTRRDVQLRVCARAASIQASCFYDTGQFESALRESQRALELAEAAKDWRLVALAICHLIERRSLTTVLDGALPLVPQARRYAMRSANPQDTAQVHLVFGRVEGRAGHLDTARRHFQIARVVLRSDPNLWLDAAIDLGEASILSLIGDYQSALEVAQRAQGKAIDSGWAKGCAVAAADLAYFWVFLGKPEEAERILRESPLSFASHPNYLVAVAETRAQAAICQHDLEAGRRILSEARYENLPNLRWYDLSCRLTEAQILLALGRWEEALQCATAGLQIASEAQSHPACAGLKLCQTEARIALGADVTGSDVELAATGATVELLAASHYTKARAFAAVGSPSRAEAQYACGARLLSSCGSAPGIARAELLEKTVAGLDGHQPVDYVLPNLDSAVTLLDLAGHPHVLGREALALIEGTACADAVALVAAGAGTVRVIEQRGWDEREAARAAASKPEGVEILPVGRYRDDMWQIVARPKTAIDPYCTFAAIRKLLATAVALDQYRRDEKQRAALWPADALEGDPDSIWASEQMAETVGIARRIAPTPLSVLLTGETGTGKEMLARAIHRASDRADKTFLPFNCTAVPRDMLESQLFGYRKGAFTGADTPFAGIIRAAAGGTLFLDEIADVTLEIQPKLLRFLETREVHPLGEPHPIAVDVRIIAATNASLEQLVADGRFREDLFYRLNVIRLKLPPLRERREEIPPLVYHYLRRYGDEQRKGRLTLSDETLEYLLLYSWPGNVRQLANEVRRVVALAEPDSTLTPAMLSPDIQASRRTIPATPAADAEVRLTLDQPLPVAVQALEQMMVQRALDRAHGRVEEASRLLGISRKGLFLKRRRLGLRHAS